MKHTCRAVVPQTSPSTVSTCLAPVGSDSSGRAARLIREMEGKVDTEIHEKISIKSTTIGLHRVNKGQTKGIFLGYKDTKQTLMKLVKQCKRLLERL